MIRTNRTRATLAASLLALFVASLCASPAAAEGKKGGKDKGKNKPGMEVSEEINVPRNGDGFDLPPYRRVVLPNGLTLLLMEQHESPIVDMNITLRSGSAEDPTGKDGLASMVADLLTSGTATRNAQEVATEIDFLGGQLGASANQDTTTIVSEFLAKDLDKQIELLADVSLKPAFAAGEVDRIKQQRLAEIASLAEDARTYTTLQFEAAIFAGTPYGHPAMGVRKTIETLTRDDVLNFYATHYVANNAIIAAVGDFNTDDLLGKLRSAFGAWARKDVPRQPFAPATPIKGRKLAIVDYPGLNQTQIRIGAVGIARNDPAFYAIQVANTALGGGFTSRLVDEIRVNRSLSYSAGSRFTASVHPGSFLISTFTKNSTTRETIDVALDVLKKFRDVPMPETELTKAKNYLLGQYSLSFETPEGLARQITTIEVNNLPKDYIETFAQNVRALSSADVAATIQKYFQYDNIVILVFTTQSETRKQLDGLGTVEVKNYLE